MKDSRITELLVPVLAQFGLELDALEVVPAGKRRLLRVVVDGDGPHGRGPLLDDIASASHALSVALDESDATGNSPYTLEVSSRGVGRPLEQPRHWRRNLTRLVSLTLADGERLTGRISAADEEGADLDVDGHPRRVAYAEVTKALVQVELNRPRHLDPAEPDPADGLEVDELEVDELEDEDEDEAEEGDEPGPQDHEQDEQDHEEER